MKLTDAIPQYEQSLKARGIVEGSRKKYLSDIKRLVEWLPKHTDWPTFDELQAWLAQQNVSRTTLHHRVANTKAFFAWAFKTKLIPDDPAHDLQHVKRSKTLPATLADYEFEWLMEKWEPVYDKRYPQLVERDKALVRIMGWAGLRRAEVAALNVGDVSIQTKTIHVRSGKGDKDRNVPMPDKLVFALKPHVQGRAHVDPLFLGKDGRRFDRNGINYVFTRKVKVGTRSLHPHMLRHSYANHLHRLGAPLRDIQELMGHASIATTEVYLHTSMKELRTSVSVFDREPTAPNPLGSPVIYSKRRSS